MDRQHRPTAAEDPRYLIGSAREQLEFDCRLYNEAVGSYNTHLGNHRERRDLFDIPYRRPITAHGSFDEARVGDPAAIDSLITELIDQAHLDSQLRCHPRVHPIHREATDQLAAARKQLIATLEDLVTHLCLEESM